MKLASIALRNFQSHSDTRISLHPGFNVIVGSSDSGKSSLVRMINWVRLNRPLGFGYLRHGGKQIDTEIAFDNGSVVQRERSKSVNKYTTTTVGSDGLPSKSTASVVGTDVPDSVASLFDLADYNVRGQHYGPYLLGEPAPVAAKKLHDISGIGEVDDAIAATKPLIAEANRAVDTGKANLKSLQQEMERLAHTELLSDGVVAAKAMLAELSQKQVACERLKGLAERAAIIQGEIDSSKPDIEKMQVLISTIGTKLASLETMKRQAGRLRATIQDVQSIQASLKKCDDSLQVANKSFDVVVKQLNSCPLCGGKISVASKKLIRDWIFGGVS